MTVQIFEYVVLYKNNKGKPIKHHEVIDQSNLSTLKAKLIDKHKNDFKDQLIEDIAFTHGPVGASMEA